jgi:hypothetical protein
VSARNFYISWFNMSINPGQRTSSIYQQDKDAFSSQLDLSAARHGSAHAKANSQVNRLSRVFDGSKGQRPPPPPSKPQALRSSTAIHRASRSDEIAIAADHSSHSPNEHFSDRPMSAASSASESVTETAAADAMTEAPTLSFKDLQAKFQRAASNTTDVKSVSFFTLLIAYTAFSLNTPSPPISQLADQSGKSIQDPCKAQVAAHHQ